MSDFHFLRPWWLLLIALLFLLLLRNRQKDSAYGGWSQSVDPELLKFLYRGPAEAIGARVRPWLLAAIWTIACVALAGPTWDRQNVKLKRDRTALVAVLDLSPSMLAADLKPSRIERARFKLKDLFSRHASGSNGLVVFAARAYPIAPLTEDANTLLNLVDVLSPELMPAAGARLDLGIEQAVELIKRAGLREGRILVLTDGANLRAFDSARAALAQGIRVSVIGVGTSEGAPVALAQGGFATDATGQVALARVDEPRLAALATAGGGRFVRLSNDESDLKAVAPLLNASDEAALAETSLSISLWRDRGPWLLLLLLPLAALTFRRGVVFVLPLLLLCPPRAEAFSFTDLWLRPDQQAARALAQGDPKKAAAIAQDPELKGSALYRDEAYARAAESFKNPYNRGTALAQAGALEDALAELKRAIIAEPQDADAQHNAAEVERALKQQQEQQQQQQDGSKKPDDDSPQQQQKQDQDKGESKPEQQQPEPGQDQPSEESGANKPEQSKDQEGKDKPQAADGKDNPQAQDGKDKLEPEPGEPGQDGDQAQPKQAQPKPAQPRPEDRLPPEERQALEQWLNRVPDDPAGLIRRQLYFRAQAEAAPDDLEEDEKW